MFDSELLAVSFTQLGRSSFAMGYNMVCPTLRQFKEYLSVSSMIIQNIL